MCQNTMKELNLSRTSRFVGQCFSHHQIMDNFESVSPSATRIRPISTMFKFDQINSHDLPNLSSKSLKNTRNNHILRCISSHKFSAGCGRALLQVETWVIEQAFIRTVNSSKSREKSSYKIFSSPKYHIEKLLSLDFSTLLHCVWFSTVKER